MKKKIRYVFLVSSNSGKNEKKYEKKKFVLQPYNCIARERAEIIIIIIIIK